MPDDEFPIFVITILNGFKSDVVIDKLLNVIEKCDAKAKMLPPLTLQLLLENVIEHNSGSKDNPNVITVEVGENLTVSNQLRPKMSKKKDGGRALKNLKSQYELLTDKKIYLEANKYLCK